MNAARIAGVIAILLALPASAATPAGTGKLDAALLAIAAQEATQVTTTARKFRLEVDAAGKRVVAVLRFNGSVDPIVAQGAILRSVIGNVATVEIPVARLTAIASMPEVVSIEASRPLVRKLDVSVPITKADQLRKGVPGNWTDGTGKGVIVAIIDSGVDFRHRDFRLTDGRTRMLGLWDQQATGTFVAPPPGFNYGRECSATMINDAIGGDENACPQPVGAHGTHVAGIAAGNGFATGNRQLPYRMIGIAPDADLIGVNDNGTNAGILDAIAFLRRKAESTGAAFVVNLSQGSYFGSRDGTSNFERGLDNLSGPGRIIVASAGNESDTPIRAIGTIAQGEAVNVGFSVLANVDSGKLELWYPGTHAYGISIAGPDCAATAVVGAGSGLRTFETACANIDVVSTVPQVNNDDRQISVTLSPPANQKIVRAGAWRVTLLGTTIPGGSAPFSIICSEDGSDLRFTDHTAAITEEILTDTSSAKRVVAVGAHNTRYSWTSVNGPFTTDVRTGDVGDLTRFSSRGPRRSCSNATKCPPVMKPEIAAPGAWIQAAMGTGTDSQANYREADGVHVAKRGTSMSAPHVTGAIALLLQKQSDLTPEQVKALLFANVQTNSYTVGLPIYNAATPDLPVNPNYAWGYGMMDVAKAATALAATPRANNFEGLWFKSPAESESGWGIDFTHQGDRIFATWFTYDRAGKPWWLISVLQRTAPGTYAGDISTVTGPPFDTVPWDRSRVKSTIVGTMKVSFDTTNDGVLSYTVNGTSQAKAITRQVFGPLPTCVWGAQTDLTTATNYQDMWYAAPAESESGWGINLTHQGDKIFATWFTYDTHGQPWWLTSTLLKNGGGSYAGEVFTTTGPAFDAEPFDPAKVVASRVGNASLNFANGNSGSFAYTVNGVSQTKPITREVFAPPGTVCH